jgi:hypothetical protein
LDLEKHLAMPPEALVARGAKHRGQSTRPREGAQLAVHRLARWDGAHPYDDDPRERRRILGEDNLGRWLWPPIC